MGTAIIYILIIFALLVASFVAKRRFGIMGLALASGSLLSGIWGYDAGLIASGIGLPSNKYIDAILTSIIILLPSVILLFRSYKCRTLAGRVSGSLLFAVLAFALLVVPLSAVWPIGGFGSNLVAVFIKSNGFIVGSCLVLAVIDLLLLKTDS